jgi:hypothetical protein
MDSPQDDAGDDQVDEENNACAYVIYSTNVPSGDHTQQIQTALDTTMANPYSQC